MEHATRGDSATQRHASTRCKNHRLHPPHASFIFHLAQTTRRINFIPSLHMGQHGFYLCLVIHSHRRLGRTRFIFTRRGHLESCLLRHPHPNFDQRLRRAGTLAHVFVLACRRAYSRYQPHRCRVDSHRFSFSKFARRGVSPLRVIRHV